MAAQNNYNLTTKLNTKDIKMPKPLWVGHTVAKGGLVIGTKSQPQTLSEASILQSRHFFLVHLQ